MEVTMIICIAISAICAYLLGFLTGRRIRKSQCDGTIFIEPTEDPNRDRVRFVLGLELDDIRKKRRLVFNVTANGASDSSKNSQSV